MVPLPPMTTMVVVFFSLGWDCLHYVLGDRACEKKVGWRECTLNSFSSFCSDMFEFERELDTESIRARRLSICCMTDMLWGR